MLTLLRWDDGRLTVTMRGITLAVEAATPQAGDLGGRSALGLCRGPASLAGDVEAPQGCG